MIKNHIQVKKIGLLNFWYYDEEEYDFYDGKLLLRGGNASGKSVTMQSFFPLILDGNKTPVRLDPFGSRDKKIEDYLIGPADSIQKPESTGYLYMETYNQETNQYITVGMGLRAKKGRPTDFFGFALKDGRRIGKDFFLYKNRAEKVPFTKSELKYHLGLENEFVETAKEYKSMVNRLLFGFPNLDSYDEFINLILQLRSPKLSNGYKPTMLMSILNNVLQPLLEEDLKPLSEAIEEMNKTKEQVELLQNHAKSLSNYIKTYHNYNETLLYHKAKNYVDEHNQCSTLQQEIETIKKGIETKKNTLEEAEITLVKKQNLLEEAKVRKSQMNASDLINKVEKQETLKNQISENTEKIESLQSKLTQNFDKKGIEKQEITSLEKELETLDHDIDLILIDINDLSEEIYSSLVSIAVSPLSQDKKTLIDYDHIESSLRKYQHQVLYIKEKLERIHHIEIRLNDSMTEHNELKKSYQETEKQLTSLESEFKEAINHFKDEFTLMHEHNEIIKLKDEDLRFLFQYLNHYTPENYEQAKKYYDSIADKIKGSLLEQKYQLKHKFDLQKDKRRDLLKEIEKVEKQKEIELVYDYDDALVQALQENEIPYVSFYKVISFKDTISESEKNALESSLLGTHLLDAKIIPEAYKEKVNKLGLPGIFLYKTTKKQYNLTKYLEPQIEDTIPFTKEDVSGILASIGIDRTMNDIAVDPSGYKLDFMEGTIDSNYQSKYIGILARQEERRRTLEKLQDELKGVDQILMNIQGFMDENEAKIKTLEQEKNGFPLGEELKNLEVKQERLEKDLDYINQKQKKLELVMEQDLKEKEKIEKEMRKEKEKLTIPLNLPKYEEVLHDIDTMFSYLRGLSKDHHSYQLKQELLDMHKTSLEEVKETISYLQTDLLEKEKTIQLANSELTVIEELLNKEAYKNLREELEELEQIINTIPTEQLKLVEQKAKTETKIKELEHHLMEKENELTIDKIYLEVYEYLLKEEYELHYVYEEPFDDIFKLAQFILKDLSTKENNTIQGVIGLYYEAYNKYRLELNDYNLNDVGILESENLISTFSKNHPEVESKIRYLLEQNSRRDIIAIYEGRKVNLLRLEESINNAVLETKDIISEQDRHLFEDILLKTVGEKIRKRIEDSEAWVKKMNKIMDDMQKDSSLSFRLAWKSKTSEDENEIDTREIIRILKMPSGMALPKDINKLVNHFRSRIKKAEMLNEDNNISYYKLIFDVLDYRNWFYFQMYYKQGKNDRKELTDKVFSRFSGGEKAKTMYIPMFASVSSKLESAREDALRTVALDEAFAGVDDDNIRELLGIMTSLDLDFIMTSQVLWGDYDVVPLLSISELFTDKSTETVAVRRYKWNGTTKVIVTNRED